MGILKTRVIFLIVGLSFMLTKAQGDSLQTKTYQELTDVIKQFQYLDTTKALAVTRYYLDKARRENEHEREWEGLYSLAAIHYQAGNYAPVKKYEIELLALLNDPSYEPYRFQTYFVVGSLNMRNGVLGRSLEYFQKAKDTAAQKGNFGEMQRAYYMINLIQAMSGDFKSAIKTQRELKDKMITADTSVISAEQRQEILFRIHTSLADTYIKAKRADSAFYFSNKALKYSKEFKDSCTVKVSYRILASSLVLQEAYEKALKFTDSSVTLCNPQSKQDSLMLGGLYGRIFLGQQKYKQAIVALENGINAYGVSEDEEGFMDDLYYTLANAYKGDGKIEKAGYYLNKHIESKAKYGEIKDTIQEKFRAAEIAGFKEELAQLENEKQTKQQYLNYLLLGASLVILALLFFLLKFYRNKKQNEAKFEALLVKINAAQSPQEIIDTKDKELEQKETTDVSEETRQLILDGLEKLEKQEYFLQQQCNSYNVAKKIGTNTSYLSKVINSHYQKNFNTYINDLRINYAIVRIKNDVLFRSYSIQSIAEEIGYKSADSFTKYFKKDTGLNPSFYIKNIKNIA